MAWIFETNKICPETISELKIFRIQKTFRLLETIRHANFSLAKTLEATA